MVNFDYALLASLLIIAIAVGIALIRLYRGPHFADRVIVFDLVSAAVIATFAALSLRLERSYLIDAAVMVALLSFLGTVGFSSFLERSDDERHDSGYDLGHDSGNESGKTPGRAPSTKKESK